VNANGELVDAILGLNADGSIDLSFGLAASSPREALDKVRETLDVLGRAIREAGPLRTDDEIERGGAVIKVAVNPVDDRAPLYAV
jgi:hypothetical protein